MQYTDWSQEGWKSVVIAHNSRYIAVTSLLVPHFMRYGWFSEDPYWPHNHQDLWESFQSDVKRFREKGVAVSLWYIPVEWNSRANSLARERAEQQVAFENQQATDINV
jgi:hypothetical protein